MPSFSIIESKWSNLNYKVHFTRDNQPFTFTLDKANEEKGYRITICDLNKQEKSDHDKIYVFDTYHEMQQFITTHIQQGILPPECCDKLSLAGKFKSRSEVEIALVEEAVAAGSNLATTVEKIKQISDVGIFNDAVRKFIDNLINPHAIQHEIEARYYLAVELKSPKREQEKRYHFLHDLEQLADLPFQVPLDAIRPLIKEVKRMQPEENTNYHPLACAAQRGHVDLVEELLAAGFRPDITDYGFSGKSALQLATESGHKVVAAKLLRAKPAMSDYLKYNCPTLHEKLVEWGLVETQKTDELPKGIARLSASVTSPVRTRLATLDLASNAAKDTTVATEEQKISPRAK